jgi:hypothetical protein
MYIAIGYIATKNRVDNIHFYSAFVLVPPNNINIAMPLFRNSMDINKEFILKATTILETQ